MGTWSWFLLHSIKTPQFVLMTCQLSSWITIHDLWICPIMQRTARESSSLKSQLLWCCRNSRISPWSSFIVCSTNACFSLLCSSCCLESAACTFASFNSMPSSVLWFSSACSICTVSLAAWNRKWIWVNGNESRQKWHFSNDTVHCVNSWWDC